MSKDIRPWLKALGFNQQNELTINGYTISVDLANKKINYPEGLTKGRETTTNFSDEENFVVLECVTRLLKQGYEPKNIVLEQAYQLGRNSKAGNADITVRDNKNVPYLIVEAKTYGQEFNKAWNKTVDNGDQLFSYDKQENKAHILALYESKVEKGKIVSNYKAIIMEDNDEYLDSLKKNNNDIRGYKDAVGGEDRFLTWKNVYKNEFVTSGIFESNIEPFNHSKPKKNISDLKEITEDEVNPKYNEFAKILRKYNVSSHENAFDKLVNLFLAKIVDEQQNPNNLQFIWNGISQDSYFNLVDRLQKMYQTGMHRFLNETVSYVSEQNIRDSFRLKKDAAEDAILKYFKELKYYSNNTFSFIEVYNEKLFNQNSKILVDVVQMLQDLKLKSKEPNQFLGDLFEGYLDSGVKQSEGQYFTPLPIVKFIVSSLPLKEIYQSSEIPKVIDYACGAGHFLNEYANEIRNYIGKDKIKDYYSNIYGIEKEYRLSKVSKISAFMYGQDDINIIYGDALANHKIIEDNSYSVIISNPPYSVTGFLDTLDRGTRNQYELAKNIRKSNISTNNNIELFFLERAKQLLKSEGMAGIIFPSSILNNTSDIYVQTRKLLLRNFDIVAVVPLSKNTFGSTGTETVILFLKKKKYPPKESDYYKYAVNRWFDIENGDPDEDAVFIAKEYCKHMNYDYDTYSELREGNIENIKVIELFDEYLERFNKSSIAKRISKKRITQSYSNSDKQRELQQAKWKYIKNIEQEKMFYFAIAKSQTEDVLVVNTPRKDINKIKKFLGYSWSKRRGSEGIKYNSSNSKEDVTISQNKALSSIQTPLFNPSNMDDNKKINYLIRNNFEGKKSDIPDELAKLVSFRSLEDMLDLGKTTFDASISLTLHKANIEINSMYPCQKLSKVASIEKGDSITREKANPGKYKVVAGGKTYAYTNNKANRDANVITVSASGNSAGYVNYWSEPIFASDCTTIQSEDVLSTQFIYYLLKSQQEQIYKYLARGSSRPHVYPANLVNILIPDISNDLKEKLVDKAHELEKQYKSSRMEEKDYEGKLNNLFEELQILAKKK